MVAGPVATGSEMTQVEYRLPWSFCRYTSISVIVTDDVSVVVAMMGVGVYFVVGAAGGAGGEGEGEEMVTVWPCVAVKVV